MIVSLNKAPKPEEFELLLSNTLNFLHSDVSIKEQYYLSLHGSRLENVIFDIMCSNSKGTSFEDSIELISGQRFPDIVASKFYGLEVKTTKSNHWKSTGSSVAEGTRVEGVERIYLLFGKLHTPVQFACKPYEACLSEVVVTHSPRYLIDMNLGIGETIFDKLNVSYDELRKQDNPIKTVLNYYKDLMKPGDSAWWFDNNDASKFIIRMWNNLSTQEKLFYKILGYCLFPELVGNCGDKFNRFALWLSTKEGIVCPNIRDIFTAGGQGEITLNGCKYSKIPQIIMGVSNQLESIKNQLHLLPVEILSLYWGEEQAVFCDRYLYWGNLIVDNIQNKSLREVVRQVIRN